MQYEGMAGALPQSWAWHLGHQARRQWRAEGLLDALAGLVGAGRVVSDLPALRALMALPVFRSRVAEGSDGDAFFHVRHRHFLARSFTARQRMACALSHFAFEQQAYGEQYHAAVYGRSGLTLWRGTGAAGREYRLVLRSNPKLRHEGPLSLVLEAGGQWLHETSWCWVEGAVIGAPTTSNPMMAFVTRNQSAASESALLLAFRRDYPQHSPPYLALAALQALARLHGQTAMAAIRADEQIAWVPALDRNFRHAYCGFWQAHGGQALPEIGYRMALPLAVRPLAEVPAKHRSRARARRQLWAEVAGSTQLAVMAHCAEGRIGMA